LEKWVSPQPQGQNAEAVVQPAVVSGLADELLSGSAELDASAGIARVAGNTELYKKILVKFIGNQCTAVEEVRGSLAVNAIEDAERIAHTLKGVSGSIGATNLQQVAARLEAAIRNGATDAIEPLLAETDVLFEKVSAFIRAALPEGAGATIKEGLLSAEDYAALTAALRMKLENYEADADTVLAKIISHELTADQQAAFAQLKEKLDGYDFDAALQVLKQLDASGVE